MRSIYFILVLTFTANFAYSQSPVSKKDVPAAVISSYVSQNSNGATDSLWTKEEISIYKVHYLDNGQRYEANYFADGRWIKTFTEIKISELPVTVSNQLKNIYANHIVSKAFIELNGEGKFYAVELLQAKEKFQVYFTISGKIVK